MTRPSLRRRRLAKALQKFREEAGLNLSEAAKLAGFSQAKLSRIELAQFSISGDDTYALCTAFNVATDVTDALVRLARQAKRGRRDWWRPYSDVLGKATDWIELEADAVKTHSFTLDVIPGLLQTEAYCKAVVQAAMPRESTEAIQKRVIARIERQKRLNVGDLELWAIIDEPALRRPIGGQHVMTEQINHIIELTRNPHVSIQILPHSVGAHFALGAPFNTFVLDDGLGVVALDSLTGGLYVEDETEVRAYEDTWSKLAAMALPFSHSIELMQSLSRDYGGKKVNEQLSNKLDMEKEHTKRQ